MYANEEDDSDEQEVSASDDEIGFVAIGIRASGR